MVSWVALDSGQSSRSRGIFTGDLEDIKGREGRAYIEDFAIFTKSTIFNTVYFYQYDTKSSIVYSGRKQSDYHDRY